MQHSPLSKTHFDTPIPLTYSEFNGKKPACIVRAGSRLVVERYHNNRCEFLFVQHPLKGWELPGGAMDPGESGKQAAMREFTEETGLEIAPPVELTLIETLPVDAGKAGYWLDLIYHAQVNPDSLESIGEPEFECRWLTLEELQGITADKYVRIIGEILQ